MIKSLNLAVLFYLFDDLFIIFSNSDTKVFSSSLITLINFHIQGFELNLEYKEW